MCESQRMSSNSISISLPFPSNEWTQQPSMATNNPPKPSTTTTTTGAMVQQQLHHNKQEALKCPRCDSSNTKFCYYNNYSLSQPRHFCKACKRYWTRGGTLRNVPVGGGSRKNKRRHHHHHHKIIKTHPSPATTIPPAAAAPRAPSSSSPLDPSTFFYPGPAGVLGAAAPHYPGLDSELAQFCTSSSDLCFVKDVMGGDGGGGASRVGNNAMNINQFDAPFSSSSYSSNPADIGDLTYSHFWNSMLSSLI